MRTESVSRDEGRAKLHALNNALTAIQLHAELADGSTYDEKIGRHLQAIVDSVAAATEGVMGLYELIEGGLGREPRRVSGSPPTRILIVEDSRLVRESLAEMLSSWGCRVETASGPQEAGAILAQKTVDILLCDLKLGAENGVEIAADARRQRPELRIVMMSGDVSPVGEGISGAVWLTKPVPPEVLKQALRGAGAVIT